MHILPHIMLLVFLQQSIKQENGDDCGVYVLLWAEARAMGKKSLLQVVSKRLITLRTIICILTQILNHKGSKVDLKFLGELAMFELCFNSVLTTSTL